MGNPNVQFCSMSQLLLDGKNEFATCQCLLRQKLFFAAGRAVPTCIDVSFTDDWNLQYQTEAEARKGER